MEEIIIKLEELLKNHCCRGYADNHNGVEAKDCRKEHLYCGYELDHGIELESVIDLIKKIK